MDVMWGYHKHNNYWIDIGKDLDLDLDLDIRLENEHSMLLQGNTLRCRL